MDLLMKRENRRAEHRTEGSHIDCLLSVTHHITARQAKLTRRASEVHARFQNALKQYLFPCPTSQQRYNAPQSPPGDSAQAGGEAGSRLMMEAMPASWLTSMITLSHIPHVKTHLLNSLLA